MGVEEAIKISDVIHNSLTFPEALKGKNIPEEIKEKLDIICVHYRSMDGAIYQGQLVVHQDVAREVIDIFNELLEQNFPIEMAVPISEYDWDDDVSMRENNSSAFNYRVIAGTDRPSNHALGLAIDINPRLNPYIRSDGVVLPEGAVHDPTIPGTLTKDSPAVKAFTDRGWTWGGNWDDPKDYQHFEKEI